MNIAIISSTKDRASCTIKEQLLNAFPFVKQNKQFHGIPVYKRGNAELYTTTHEITGHEDIDCEIDADLFLFISRHASVSGVPALTAHPIGNFGEAKLGGRSHALCSAPALYLAEAIVKLQELNPVGYQVIQEATHHGPYLKKPALFIELGSTEKEWGDIYGASLLAQVIEHLITCNPKERATAIGIGGLHHAPSFTKQLMKENTIVAHICAKYHLPDLTSELVREAIEKTSPQPKQVYLDWKGSGDAAQRAKLVAMLDAQNIPWKKI